MYRPLSKAERQAAAQRLSARREQQAKREESRRIRDYLKAIGNDRSVVTQLRRMLAKMDMGPKKRMAMFSIARLQDDSMRFDSRRRF